MPRSGRRQIAARWSTWRDRRRYTPLFRVAANRFFAAAAIFLRVAAETARFAPVVASFVRDRPTNVSQLGNQRLALVLMRRDVGFDRSY